MSCPGTLVPRLAWNRLPVIVSPTTYPLDLDTEGESYMYLIFIVILHNVLRGLPVMSNSIHYVYCILSIYFSHSHYFLSFLPCRGIDTSFTQQCKAVEGKRIISRTPLLFLFFFLPKSLWYFIH